MPKLALIFLLFASFHIFLLSTNIARAERIVWNLESLYEAPSVYSAPGIMISGENALYYDAMISDSERRENAKNAEVQALLFTGPEFKGHPTQVFAFYGRPIIPSGKKVPAMVLVHGGGGTAFESWVRLWNSRGYAAIAIDTCGNFPEGTYGNWKRNEHGGPNHSSVFTSTDSSVYDHWTYHAVANIILAHSLIRSFEEVDTERIGITGISWGGYLTCIAASLDSRFKLAVPVYGCGFLNSNSFLLSEFEKMGDIKTAKWVKLWDPSMYLEECRMPTLWVTGTNDFAYPMDSFQKTYRLSKGKRTLCIRIEMPHGHGGPGETPEEIFAFADSLCKSGNRLPEIVGQGLNGTCVWADFKSEASVTKAELCYTKDRGSWQERKWLTVPAAMTDNRASADLPEGVSVYYLNLSTDSGLLVSTEHSEIETVENSY